MFGYHFRASHLRLIGLHYARHSIRNGTGIIFSWVLLFVGLVIASMVLVPFEEMFERQKQQLAQQGVHVPPADIKKQIVDEATNRVGREIVQWATGSATLTEFFVHDRPAVVSGILIVLLFSLPYFICLGSFNQLSGDIQYKGLRYLLLRTERANLFLGRFLGTLLFTMVVLAILVLVIFLYLVLKADFYPAGQVGPWLLHGYCAMVLFALPYIALCSWFSAAIDTPMVALIVCELLVLAVPLIAAQAARLEPKLEYIAYLAPWPLKYQLLHPQIGMVAVAAAAMLAYTLFFLWLGLRTFQTRDL